MRVIMASAWYRDYAGRRRAMTVYCPECGKPNTAQATQCASCEHELKPEEAKRRFKGTMMMMNFPAKDPGIAPPTEGEPPIDPEVTVPEGGRKFGKTIMGTPPGGVEAPGVPATRPHAQPPPRGRFKKTMMMGSESVSPGTPAEPSVPSPAAPDPYPPRLDAAATVDEALPKIVAQEAATPTDADELRLPVRSIGWKAPLLVLLVAAAVVFVVFRLLHVS